MTLPFENTGASVTLDSRRARRGAISGRILRCLLVVLGVSGLAVTTTAITVSSAASPAAAQPKDDCCSGCPAGGGEIPDTCPTPTAPPIPFNLCPNGEVACQIGESTTPDGSATATVAGITATASGGEGEVVVGEYSSDPEGSPFASTGAYFDVSLPPGSTFTAVTVTITNLSGGDTLVWWNGTSWVPVVGDPGPTYSSGPPPSLTVTLDDTTTPTLAELTGTPFGVVIGVPASPSGLTATAGDGQASFTWDAPSSDGGTPVTSYSLRCSPSGSETTAATSATISGLTNGVTYTCTVAATNGVGTGPSSSQVMVTPSAPTPSAPTVSTEPTTPVSPTSPTSPTSSTGPCSGYTGNGAFLCSAYESLLGRMPDPGGLSYWEAKLAAGTSRTQVAYDIEASTEYRHDLVGAIYESYLGRAADPGGLATFTDLLASGATDQEVISDIIGSQEFFNDSGATNSGFVTRAYLAILGRSPDPGGLATFTGMLNSGVSRTQVAYDLLIAPESQTDTVTFYYKYLLGRAPDPGGLATQLGLLNSGGTVEQLVANLVGSTEYYADSTTP